MHQRRPYGNPLTRTVHHRRSRGRTSREHAIERKARILPLGSLVLLSAGSNEDQAVIGLYRVLSDLDLDDAIRCHVASLGSEAPVFPDLPPNAFGPDDGCYSVTERAFIAWLVEERLVEHLPTRDVFLRGGFREGMTHLSAEIMVHKAQASPPAR